MIETLCHMAYLDDLTRSCATQYDLMLARAVYVHHEAEGHRDGSVAFPP
jgi:hypothetical protein